MTTKRRLGCKEAAWLERFMADLGQRVLGKIGVTLRGKNVSDEQSEKQVKG